MGSSPQNARRVFRRVAFYLLWAAIPSCVVTSLLFWAVPPGALLTILIYAPFCYLVGLTHKGRFDSKKSRALPPFKKEPVQNVQITSQRVQLEPTLAPLSGTEQSAVKLLEQLRDEVGEAQRGNAVAAPAKKSRRAPVWLVIALSSVCVVLIAVCCLFFYQNQVLSAESEQQQEQLALLKSELSIVKSKNESLTNKNNNLEDKYDNVFSKFQSIKPEYLFWHESAVLVTEYGNKYHSYDCQYVRGRTYWIYNVENAVYKGYTPCSVCNPPAP